MPLIKVVATDIGIEPLSVINVSEDRAQRWLERGLAVSPEQDAAEGEVVPAPPQPPANVEIREDQPEPGPSLDDLDLRGTRHRNELVAAGFDTVRKIAEGDRQALVDVWGVGEDDVDELQSKARSLING